MSPSIAQQICQASSSLEARTRLGEFYKLASMLLRHKTPFNASKSVEVDRATPRVAGILKTAVTAGNLTDSRLTVHSSNCDGKPLAK